MAKITYDNKVALDEQSTIAEINKVTDQNMNEIKNVVNENDTILQNIKGIVAWENPNPTQEMGTGIEINLPTNDWDVIKIYYINYINFPVVESVEGLKGRDVQLSSLFYYPASQSSFAGSRRLDYINDTKYIIRNAIAMVDQNVFVTQEVRPDWIIPLKIILYKTGNN